MQWFQHSAICLFLNKTDLLEEKLVKNKIPLNSSGLFPDAPTDGDVESAKKWFEKKFLQVNSNPKREIYTHFTCATDTKTIDAVMGAVSVHILKENLLGSGIGLK